MIAPIFLAVFLGLVLARAACWAFVQTIWLPLTHRRSTVQSGRVVTSDEPVRGIPREQRQDEVGKAEQWLHWAALKIPAASDPRYFKAAVRLSVAAVEYRRSLGEALDRHFDAADEAPALEPRDASNGDGEFASVLDQSTRFALYAFEATLYDDEAARRNRLSAAISTGFDALRQRQVLSRAHRVALEEYASGAWRPAKDDPGPALVTAVRALITAVDAIQGP
jgi:hypothetical protein